MSQSPFPPNPYGNQPAKPGIPNPAFPNPGVPNPYVQGQPGPSPGTGPGYPPVPYVQSGYPRQFGSPPAKSNSLLWVLGILGSLALFCCLGCGGLFTTALVWGLRVEANLVKTELENSPKAVAELGTPIEVKVNMGASIAHDENGIFVFDVSGPKGKGVVQADCDASTEEVYECYLEVNGKTIDVLEDENLDEMDESITGSPEVIPLEK